MIMWSGFKSSVIQPLGDGQIYIQSKRAQEVRVPVGKSLADLSFFDFCTANVYKLFKGTVLMVFKLGCSLAMFSCSRLVCICTDFDSIEWQILRGIVVYRMSRNG